MKFAPGKFLAISMGLISLGLWQAPAGTAPSQFESVTQHVRIYHDVINVGMLRSHGKTLLIDSGEGSILQAAKKAGISPIDWVLCTHHHRDQCSGAALMKKIGAKIAVPAAEAQFFRNATEFWLHADNILDYRFLDFRPDLFVLRKSVVPDRELRPGDVFQWEGLDVQVVATPGHTDGSVTYIVNIDGQKIAFTGDLIYGPGQLWEFYSLQKRFPGMQGDYWAFGGAVPELLKSLGTVLSCKPSVLVPSHGVVMRNPNEAASLLRNNLDAAMKNYLALAAWRVYERTGDSFFKHVKTGYDAPMLVPLPAALLPPWHHQIIETTSSYIEAEDRSIFLFDCAYEPALQEIDRRVKAGSISGVDGVWISHYHFDHLSSVNEIRRKYGAKVYVQSELRDILENPRAYPMPCLFPESIHVDHPLSEGEVVNWKGYKLTAYYFPGQTIYHDGLLIEHDGTRVFMSGDSFANWGIDDYCSYNRNFLGKDGEINGYGRCLRLLLKLKPDLLVAAHWGALPISEEHLRKTLKLLEEREALFSSLLPWDNPNFGLDPYWIRAYPYRQSISKGQRVTLEARIYNHSDSPRRASVELRVPVAWRKVSKPDPITIAPHTEGKIRLSAVAPATPSQHREVLGLVVHFGDRNLGEIAEAIVDYLR